MPTETSTTPTTGAPARAEPLAIELMSTVWADRDGLHDSLATTAAASAWWDAVADRLPAIRSPRGSSRRTLTATEAASLRDLRDAVRRVAEDVTTDPRTVEAYAGARPSVDDAVGTINAAVATLPPRELRRGHGPLRADRVSATPVASSFGAFAEDAVALLAGDHASGTLRACLAPGCVLFFVQDHPRREWCSPACGNRARVARHYERTQAARRATSDG